MKRKPPDLSEILDGYFPGAIGQDKLKTELYQAFVGAIRIGQPIPHALLIGPPGYGKSDRFTPGIAKMTGFEVVGPFSISRNMKLDSLFLGPFGVSHKCALVQAMGKKPLIVLEELANIGRPNTGRLLTWLSEGYFTSLVGDTWYLGKPGVEWAMAASTNDDGDFLAALVSRLEFFRFDPYTLADLADIGFAYADSTAGVELDMNELFEVAKNCESPRDMIKKVRRMLALGGVDIQPVAVELRKSLRIDEDGLHADHCRVLVDLFDLGGRAPQAALAKAVKVRTSTLSGWLAELAQRGFVNAPKAGNGGGTSLTELGKAKAAALKVAMPEV